MINTASRFIELLVKYGGDICHKNNKGETPLTIVKKYKNKHAIECINFMMKNKIYIATKAHQFH